MNVAGVIVLVAAAAAIGGSDASSLGQRRARAAELSGADPRRQGVPLQVVSAGRRPVAAPPGGLPDLQWPTIHALAMVPVLVLVLVQARLARAEYREVTARFGDAWNAYSARASPSSPASPAATPRPQRIVWVRMGIGEDPEAAVAGQQMRPCRQYRLNPALRRAISLGQRRQARAQSGEDEVLTGHRRKPPYPTQRAPRVGRLAPWYRLTWPRRR
jgi:hypothetical protein